MDLESKRARSAHRRTELVISSKIFVGNLNFGTTDEELREFFGAVGEVVDIHIPKDRDTGRPRGFAFVRFASEDQAKQAVEQLHGKEVGGRPLRLDIAEDRPRAPRPRSKSSDRQGGPRPRHADDLARGGPDQEDFGREDYYQRDDYGRDYSDHDDDHGGRGKSFSKPKRPKGSRRGLRAKKRSL